MTAGPTRPRLVDGLVLAQLERGVVFDGAARRQVLRGPAASALLPRLLPLLDGSRPLATLAAELPDITPATIAQAVTLLWDRGLVEEGSGRRPHHADVHPEVAAFAGRLAGSTSHNGNGDEALGRLAAADVIVVAEDRAAGRLAAELTDTAIGRVRTASIGSLPQVPLPAGSGTRPLVVALEPSAERADGLARLDDWSADTQVPWLRTAIDGGTVEIGPYFDGRSGPCYRCFAAGRPATSATSATSATRAEPPATDRAMAAWASLVAMEVGYLTARIGRTVSTARVTRLDLDAWSSTHEPAIRQPGCARCCPVLSDRRRPVTTAYRREQAGVLPAPELVELADHRSRPTRAWPSLPLAIGPRPTQPGQGWTGPANGKGNDRANQDSGNRPETPGRARLSAARLNPQLLACVLGPALGLAGPGQDPTPGAPAVALAALSPVQAYVYTHRIVGLGTGWHWWDSRQGVLIPVHAVEGAAHRTPGAVIALTAAVAQLEESHGAAGHRLAHLASGRVAYSLLDGLARAGMPARLRPEADDPALAGLLGLDPASEPVTALIDLPGPAVPS